MIILFCYLIAHVVIRAAEETWGYAKDHAKGGARKAVGDFVGRHKEDYKYGPGSWKFWAWLAGGAAWITGKSLKHGVGGVRAAVRGARKGRVEAKEKIRLAKAHRDARKVNKQIDWEEMLAWLSEKLRDDTVLPQTEVQPEDETPEARVRDIPQTEKEAPQGPPERTEIPQPEVVDAEILASRTPRPRTPSDPEEIWDVEVIADREVLEIPNETPLEITQGRPQGEIETMTVPATETPLVEVLTTQNARDCMTQIGEVLAGESAQVEACVATIDATRARLAAAQVAVEGLLNGFDLMDMDPITIGQATNIMEGLMAALARADETRTSAAGVFEGVQVSQVATSDTLEGMNDRHAELEQAHANADHAATREAYATA